MKLHRYTNKDEKPIPRYKVGQRVWIFSHLFANEYVVEQTIIRKVLLPIWVDYSDNPYWDDVPHWEIKYRHKPQINDRMVQYPIEEEAIYDTKEAALQAQFKKFKINTFRRLEQFREQFKALDIKCQNVKFIE